MSLNNIQQTLVRFLAQYPHNPILIAYSGGIDSQVLLDCLTHLKQTEQISNTLHVCHVNHGLSQNALSWQHFAEQQTSQRAVGLTVCNVNLERKTQQSLEAIAREARYQALKQTADKLAETNVLIMTGHHQDDQLETFLLALKRGAGLKGLSAMLPIISAAEHYIARPLLACTREQIEQYANAQGLLWIEDESNQDIVFDRNFLRQTIIPQLKQRWPHIAQTAARSAGHCQEGQQLIEELAQDDLKHCEIKVEQQNKHKEHYLTIDALLELTHARLVNLLRYYLAKHNLLMPSVEQLNQVIQQLTAESDKAPLVVIGNYCFRHFKHQLVITPNYTDVQNEVIELSLAELRSTATKIQKILPDDIAELILSVERNYQSSVTEDKQTIQKIGLPESNEIVRIMFSHKNEKVLPDYRQQRREMKKVLQELNIPPWQRKRIPFLYYGGKLVAALGYFVCQEFIPKKCQDYLQIKLK
jgi:tRNA(Ile)-lysidine synthase